MATADYKAPSMTRAEYRESVRKGAAGNFTCEHCGSPAYRRLSGTSKSPNRFCSMACRVLAAEVKNAAKAAKRQAQRALIAAIKHLIKARKPKASSYRMGQAPAVRTCPCCSLTWSAVTWYGPTQHCPTDDCQEALKALNRKTRRDLGNTYRTRARRMGRKFKGFNVNRVFERDRWTCQLCGVKTPKRLRGTQAPNAPELDHIIALAAGGDHIIENVQCACRACNGAKGASALGQLWLLGFADTRVNP